MKNNSMRIDQLLRYCAFFGGALLAGSQAHAQSNLNMGLSINSGNAYGSPMFGYGGAAGSFGSLNSCMGSGGSLGGGGSYLPPPPTIIPPHLQGGGYYGGGMVGSPYRVANTGCSTYCEPTFPYGQAQFQGAVQGGPQIMNSGVGVANGGAVSGSNVYSISGGGTTVIDMRDRVEDNSGDIIWAAALGMGMQAPNVYPYVGDRGSPTNFGNFFYQEGNRDWTLQPRPHAGP
ncbi:MAG: hypothetical protein ABIR96_11795 [Bdellovibrionota bacterium]